MGWCHESFIVARHVKPSLRSLDFSIDQFANDLFSGFPDIDALNFILAQQRGAEDKALSFFCHLNSYNQAVSLRAALGKLSFDHACLVLLFLFSGLRWRILRMPLKTCPYCPKHELLWLHFFECECVFPYLAAEFLSTQLLFRYVEQRRWRDVFSLIGNVIVVWCELLSTCALDVDIVWSLVYLP